MRVIAGNYRSRPLKAVPGKNTRPTTDKIKESMFNLLATALPINGFCLDFYAGSGALAIESVSRGMAGAVLCEKDRRALSTIKENLKMTREEDKFTLLGGNNRSKLSDWAMQSKQRFDLVFLDPPYAESQVEQDLNWLIKNELLNLHCLVVCEADEKHVLNEIPGFVQLKHKKYGITVVQIYEFQGKV
ncbi:16S rRNA (guanine(966)-N(2))-methyltransferase RsmD [Facklamia miroungae]|uniref:16S rRNA (Guanine966-N2)-methyltransferase n=1 Tax=Facklamia miroungae TaxID=120956 RepID=A0A1G7U583_9LACT|nr:16S rRNA (guanine(966)-N(2))-methyltransferase RsmD [Facklamia miroungae]NKZ29915.1 16S rRNA (guanine(966)-N(2))-methyltransferase RsmD [Facklamia miroungae]SDG42548.1 16S rRNA (guanine966-N2)-methyltransferase [Facklamia miroungae]